MPVSKVQLEVWRIREELDRKLAKMTPEQRQEYFADTLERVKAVLGRDLNLPIAKPGPTGPIITEAEARRG